MIRKDGIVKVLDFGLAKLVHPGAQGADGTHECRVGYASRTVMGTTPYMSPEQARGLQVEPAV